MDPPQLWGIESCRASSLNNENLSVLFSKHNVWHQALPSACLYLAALPARGKACGSLVSDLVRKKAKTIGVPGRKDLRANQKRIHAKPHCFHPRPTALPLPPRGKEASASGISPSLHPEHCALNSKNKLISGPWQPSVSWPWRTLNWSTKDRDVILNFLPFISLSQMPAPLTSSAHQGRLTTAPSHIVNAVKASRGSWS